jgi:hypothetical protein
MIINQRPTASVTHPFGTYTNPGVGGTRPQIEFELTDPDPHSRISQYEIWIGREDGSEVLQVVKAGLYSPGAFSYQVPVDLPAGYKLQVRVRGWDQFGLDSAWSASQWFLTNRPPVPSFDWSPKPVWEGDQVTLVNRSSDPDGDSLMYHWEIKDPDGIIAVANSENLTRIFSKPGVYNVMLSVSDGIESASITHSIVVQELMIAASVSHTPYWLELHGQRGHNTTAIPLDFYSGERFQLELTASSAPVNEVTAWIDTIGMDGNALYVAATLQQSTGVPTVYHGELFDSKFLSTAEGLEEGLLLIHFQVTYMNGVIKAVDVPVKIIGSVLRLLQVHRQQ